MPCRIKIFISKFFIIWKAEIVIMLEVIFYFNHQDIDELFVLCVFTPSLSLFSFTPTHTHAPNITLSSL